MSSLGLPCTVKAFMLFRLNSFFSVAARVVGALNLKHNIVYNHFQLRFIFKPFNRACEVNSASKTFYRLS